MIFNSQPILENELVKIRPLITSDFDDLFLIASDNDIWEQHPAKERSTLEGFTKFFEDAIATKSAFLIIEKATNEVIGTSRYHLNEVENAIEIGWTFYAKKFWGGTFNKVIKHLMMEYAFQSFDYILFYIDENNLRSQKAVEKIGGKRVENIDNIALIKRSSADVIYCIRKVDF